MMMKMIMMTTVLLPSTRLCDGGTHANATVQNICFKYVYIYYNFSKESNQDARSEGWHASFFRSQARTPQQGKHGFSLMPCFC